MVIDWVVLVSIISLFIVFMFACSIDRSQNSNVFRREVHQLRTIRMTDRKNAAKLYIDLSE